MPDSGIRAVLRAPQVLLVLTASQVGRLPLASAPLALLIHARQTQSLTLAGLTVAVYTAGMALSAPLLARTVDRWRQPPVLWGSAVLSAAGFLIVASAGDRLPYALTGAMVAASEPRRSRRACGRCGRPSCRRPWCRPRTASTSRSRK